METCGFFVVFLEKSEKNFKSYSASKRISCGELSFGTKEGGLHVSIDEPFFLDINLLGGPDKATPKTIMRVMGVKGLTLYHQVIFRLGKQPHKEFNDHSVKDGDRATSLELQRNSASSSGMIGRNMNEMQMEVQRRLHEQLEVQRHLQLRIEAQGKYMQTILEKACQTLGGEENMALPARTFKGIGNQGGLIPPFSVLKSLEPSSKFLVIPGPEYLWRA
ncbi:Myb transcription factor ipn2 [Datura stramonium]|uniref:Myb transcription factor ipn2 n=1 Tax=Datura stramonium TaxID=4076 RepID=A0ABS8V086_DATST|nr:Myb transcription factor ipn2 [Datura stramonium]